MQSSDKHLLRVWYLLLMLSSCFATITQAEELNKQALLDRLKSGGLVVFFRHAATNKAQVDHRPIDLSSCKKQRNLSNKGIADSILIKKVFEEHSIPVAEVLSSPFCRCRDTAKLAFRDFLVDENLYFSIGLSKEKRSIKTRALTTLLSSVPSSGNRILISHTTNLKEATGIWPQTEGGAYLFKPLTNQQFKYLGHLLPNDWENLN